MKTIIRRLIIAYMLLIIMFAGIFMLSAFSLDKNTTVFGLGFSPVIENWAVMILSIGAIMILVKELLTLV